MKRRLLLIESDPANQNAMMTMLKDRFKSLQLICAKNLDEANRSIIDHGCDLILTNLSLADGESPGAIIHALQSYAQGVPIIALTSMDRDDAAITDVTVIGVRDVLFHEDVLKNPSALVIVLMSALREMGNRETRQDHFTGQVQSLSQKVWDVDGRIRAMETILGTLTLSIDKMTQAIDKRGGLEDRLKELEKAHAFGVKIVITVVSLAGTIITGVVTYIIKN